MTRFECAHEQDVLDALTSRRWPARCDDELRDHVASCALCTDLLTVASALRDAEQGEYSASDVPPSSVVWWRAQLRAREDAARVAARPVRLAQHVALVVGVALILLAAWAAVPYARTPLVELVAGIPRFNARLVLERVVAALPTFDTTMAAQTVLAALASPGVQLAAGAWLILAPIAIYLAVARD